MIKNDANINIQDKNGNSLVHKAAQDTDEKLLNWCIKNKAIMNIKNKNKQTPRMVANQVISKYLSKSSIMPIIYHQITVKILRPITLDK